MSEEVKQNIEQNINPVIAQPQEAKQQEVVKSVETEEEINWKKFRQEQAELRKRNQEAERIAKEKEKEAEAFKKAMEALLDKPVQQPVEENQEDEIDKRVKEHLRIREIELEKRRAEQEKIEMPKRLQSAFSDFDKVITDENIDYLAYHYPEVHQAFKNMPDNFESWASLYKALKRFIPNKDSKQEMKKAEENLKKPVSISKSGLSQTPEPGPARHLTEDRMKANYARMQKVMKGI